MVGIEIRLKKYKTNQICNFTIGDNIIFLMIVAKHENTYYVIVYCSLYYNNDYKICIIKYIF